jgi:hypothetical protein
MTEDVTEPWMVDDVRKLTDTDLEAKRYARGVLYGADETVPRLIATALDAEGLSERPVVIDRALRVEVAALIDNRELPFTRDDYDVAYTIPPASWVQRQSFPERELVTVERAREMGIDVERQRYHYSTAEVVHEMIEAGIDAGVIDSHAAVARDGLRRLVGHR